MTPDLAALRRLADAIIIHHVTEQVGVGEVGGCVICWQDVPCDAIQAAQAILALVEPVEVTEAESTFQREQAARANARVKAWTDHLVMRGLTLQPHALEGGMAVELPTPEAATALIEESDRLRVERDALAREQAVPGHYICDQCGFLNVRQVVHAESGTVSPGAAVACPNDGGTMRAWTWKEAAEASRGGNADLHVRLDAAESDFAALRAGLEEYGRHDFSCASQQGPNLDNTYSACDCGLDALLRDGNVSP